MSDLMEMLAAANPDLSDDPLPPLDDVWRKLDHATVGPSSAWASLRVSGWWWRRGTMRWATVGVAAVAAVLAVLVVGTTGGGPASAFAGWTATPTTPSAAQLASAEAACAEQMRHQRMPALSSAVPTVVDGRGPTSMLVYADSSTSVPTPRFPSGRPFTTVCITGIPSFGTSVGSGDADTSVAPGTILPGLHEEWRASSGQGFGSLDGKVGTGVSAVTLVLDDGTSVGATISGGWFAAWWPTRENVQYAEVTTSTGTSRQPVYGPAGSGPPTTGSVPSPAVPSADGRRSADRPKQDAAARRCVRDPAACTRHRIRNGHRITIVGNCVRCS